MSLSNKNRFGVSAQHLGHDKSHKTNKQTFPNKQSSTKVANGTKTNNNISEERLGVGYKTQCANWRQVLKGGSCNRVTIAIDYDINFPVDEGASQTTFGIEKRGSISRLRDNCNENGGTCQVFGPNIDRLGKVRERGECSVVGGRLASRRQEPDYDYASALRNTSAHGRGRGRKSVLRNITLERNLRQSYIDSKVEKQTLRQVCHIDVGSKELRLRDQLNIVPNGNRQNSVGTLCVSDNALSVKKEKFILSGVENVDERSVVGKRASVGVQRHTNGNCNERSREKKMEKVFPNHSSNLACGMASSEKTCLKTKRGLKSSKIAVLSNRDGKRKSINSQRQTEEGVNKSTKSTRPLESGQFTPTGNLLNPEITNPLPNGREGKASRRREIGDDRCAGLERGTSRLSEEKVFHSSQAAGVVGGDCAVNASPGGNLVNEQTTLSANDIVCSHAPRAVSDKQSLKICHRSDNWNVIGHDKRNTSQHKDPEDFSGVKQDCVKTDPDNRVITGQAPEICDHFVGKCGQTLHNDDEINASSETSCRPDVETVRPHKQVSSIPSYQGKHGKTGISKKRNQLKRDLKITIGKTASDEIVCSENGTKSERYDFQVPHNPRKLNSGESLRQREFSAQSETKNSSSHGYKHSPDGIPEKGNLLLISDAVSYLVSIPGRKDRGRSTISPGDQSYTAEGEICKSYASEDGCRTDGEVESLVKGGRGDPSTELLHGDKATQAVSGNRDCSLSLSPTRGYLTEGEHCLLDVKQQDFYQDVTQDIAQGEWTGTQINCEFERHHVDNVITENAVSLDNGVNEISDSALLVGNGVCGLTDNNLPFDNEECGLTDNALPLDHGECEINDNDSLHKANVRYSTTYNTQARYTNNHCGITVDYILSDSECGIKAENAYPNSVCEITVDNDNHLKESSGITVDNVHHLRDTSGGGVYTRCVADPSSEETVADQVRVMATKSSGPLREKNMISSKHKGERLKRQIGHASLEINLAESNSVLSGKQQQDSTSRLMRPTISSAIRSSPEMAKKLVPKVRSPTSPDTTFSPPMERKHKKKSENSKGKGHTGDNQRKPPSGKSDKITSPRSSVSSTDASVRSGVSDKLSDVSGSKSSQGVRKSANKTKTSSLSVSSQQSASADSSKRSKKCRTQKTDEVAESEPEGCPDLTRDNQVKKKEERFENQSEERVVKGDNQRTGVKSITDLKSGYLDGKIEKTRRNVETYESGIDNVDTNRSSSERDNALLDSHRSNSERDGTMLNAHTIPNSICSSNLPNANDISIDCGSKRTVKATKLNQKARSEGQSSKTNMPPPKVDTRKTKTSSTNRSDNGQKTTFKGSSERKESVPSVGEKVSNSVPRSGSISPTSSVASVGSKSLKSAKSVINNSSNLKVERVPSRISLQSQKKSRSSLAVPDGKEKMKPGSKTTSDLKKADMKRAKSGVKLRNKPQSPTNKEMLSDRSESISPRSSVAEPHSNRSASNSPRSSVVDAESDASHNMPTKVTKDNKQVGSRLPKASRLPTTSTKSKIEAKQDKLTSTGKLVKEKASHTNLKNKAIEKKEVDNSTVPEHSKDSNCDDQNDSKPKRKNLKEVMNRRQRELSPMFVPEGDCSELSGVEESIPSISDYETDKMEKTDQESSGPAHVIPCDQSSESKIRNTPKSLTSLKAESKKSQNKSYTKKISPQSPSSNSRKSPGSPKTEIKKSPTSPSCAKKVPRSPRTESKLVKPDSKLPKKLIQKRPQPVRNVQSLSTLEQRYTAEKLELMRLKIPAEMDFSDVSRPSTREGSVDSRFEDDRWSVCSDISSISRASSVSISSGIRTRGSKVPTRITVPSSRVKPPSSRLPPQPKLLQNGTFVPKITQNRLTTKDLTVKKSVPGKKPGSKKGSPEENKMLVKTNATKYELSPKSSCVISQAVLRSESVSKSSICSEWLSDTAPLMGVDVDHGTLITDKDIMISHEQGNQDHFPVASNAELIDKNQSFAGRAENNKDFMQHAGLTCRDIESDRGLAVAPLQASASKADDVNTSSDRGKQGLHSQEEPDTCNNEETDEGGQYVSISPANQMITDVHNKDNIADDGTNVDLREHSTDLDNFAKNSDNFDSSAECNKLRDDFTNFDKFGDKPHSVCDIDKQEDENGLNETENLSFEKENLSFEKENLSSEANGQYKQVLLGREEVNVEDFGLPRALCTLSPGEDRASTKSGTSDNIDPDSTGSEHANNKHLHLREGGATIASSHPCQIAPTPCMITGDINSIENLEMDKPDVINVKEERGTFQGEFGGKLSKLSQVKEIKTEAGEDRRIGAPMEETGGEAYVSLSKEFMGCDKNREDFERQFDKNDKISINKPVHISGVADKHEKGCSTKTAASQPKHVGSESSLAQEDFDTLLIQESETDATQGRHGGISEDIKSSVSHTQDRERVQGWGVAGRSGFSSEESETDGSTLGPNSGDTPRGSRREQQTAHQQTSEQPGPQLNDDSDKTSSCEEGNSGFAKTWTVNSDRSDDENGYTKQLDIDSDRIDLSCDKGNGFTKQLDLDSDIVNSSCDESKPGYTKPLYFDSDQINSCDEGDNYAKTWNLASDDVDREMESDDMTEKQECAESTDAIYLRPGFIPDTRPQTLSLDHDTTEKTTVVVLSPGTKSGELIDHSAGHPGSTDPPRTDAGNPHISSGIQIHVNYNGVGSTLPACRPRKPADKSPGQKCDRQTLGRTESARGDKRTAAPMESRLIIDKRNLHPEGYDDNVPIQRKIILNPDLHRTRDKKVVRDEKVENISKDSTHKLDSSGKHSQMPSGDKGQNSKLKVTVSKFESQKEAAKPSNRLQTYKPVHKSEFLKQSSVRKSLASRAQQKAITARFSQDSGSIKVNKAKEGGSVLMKPQSSMKSEKTVCKANAQSTEPHVTSIEFSLKKEGTENERQPSISTKTEESLEIRVGKLETKIEGDDFEERSKLVTPTDSDTQDYSIDTEGCDAGSHYEDRETPSNDIIIKSDGSGAENGNCESRELSIEANVSPIAEKDNAVKTSVNSSTADDNIPLADETTEAADTTLTTNYPKADNFSDGVYLTLNLNRNDEKSQKEDNNPNMDKQAGKSQKIPPIVSPKPRVSITSEGKIDLSYVETSPQISSVTDNTEPRITDNEKNLTASLDNQNTGVGFEPRTMLTVTPPREELVIQSFCHTYLVNAVSSESTADYRGEEVITVPNGPRSDCIVNKFENELTTIPVQTVVTPMAPPGEESTEMCSYDKSAEVVTPCCSSSETVSKQLKRSTGTTSLQRWQAVKNKFLGKPAITVSKEKVNIGPTVASVEKTIEEFEVCLEKKSSSDRSKEKSDEKVVDCSRVSEIRRSLSERLAKSPVPDTPPSTPSPSPTRKYKWIREGGIWKKKFLSDSGESGSEAEDYFRENRDETLTLPANRCERNIERESSSESECKPVKEGRRGLLGDRSVDIEFETSASEVDEMDLTDRWIKADTRPMNTGHDSPDEGVCEEKVDFETIMQRFNNRLTDTEKDRKGEVRKEKMKDKSENDNQEKSSKDKLAIDPLDKSTKDVDKWEKESQDTLSQDTLHKDSLKKLTEDSEPENKTCANHIVGDISKATGDFSDSAAIDVQERIAYSKDLLLKDQESCAVSIQDSEKVLPEFSDVDMKIDDLDFHSEPNVDYVRKTNLLTSLQSEKLPERSSDELKTETFMSRDDKKEVSKPRVYSYYDNVDYDELEFQVCNIDNIETSQICSLKTDSLSTDKSSRGENDFEKKIVSTHTVDNKNTVDSRVNDELDRCDENFKKAAKREQYLASVDAEQTSSLGGNADNFSQSMCNKLDDVAPSPNPQQETSQPAISMTAYQGVYGDTCGFHEQTTTMLDGQSSQIINVKETKTSKNVDKTVVTELREKFIPIEASPMLQRKSGESFTTLNLEDQVSVSAAESSENISSGPLPVSNPVTCAGKLDLGRDASEREDTESERSSYYGYDTTDTICDDELDTTVTDDESDLCELVINEDLDDTVVGAEGGNTEVDLRFQDDDDLTPIAKQHPDTLTSKPGSVPRFYIGSSKSSSSSTMSGSDSEYGYWGSRKAFWEKDSHELLAEISELEESFETIEGVDTDTVSQHSTSSSPAKVVDQGGTTPKRLRRKKSARRSLSLPSGTLSYGDVKITYIDGHFVAEPPEGSEDLKPKCKRDSVCSGGIPATSSESIASSGNEDTLSIVSDLALREELLTWLNQHLVDSDVFFSQSLDWNSNHVGSDSSSHSSQSSLAAMIPASSTLPRRTGRDNDGNRPVSVDEIHLLRNAYFQEQLENLGSEGQGHSEQVTQDSLLSDPRNGRRRLSVQDDKSERARSKSPNFFKRMLAKRKSFSDKLKMPPEEGPPRKDTSIVRRMSLKSLFKRKTRKGSDDPDCPPIAAFLQDEDIGAVSSLPNSPFISKRVHRVQTDPQIQIRPVKRNDAPVTSQPPNQSTIASRAGHTRPNVPPRRKSSTSSMRHGSLADRSSGEYSVCDFDIGLDDTLTSRSVSPSVADTVDAKLTLDSAQNRLNPKREQMSPQEVEKLSGSLVRGDIPFSNSNDSGIQHDAVILSSCESLKVSPDSSVPINVAVKLRKTPSPKQERPKSDITVRWADSLEQIRETDVTYRKDGTQLRKRPRPKSDLGGSTLLAESMRAFGSIGNLRPCDSLRSLRLTDGIQVELRSNQDVRVVSAKLVKSRRMSTPHPIKNRTDKRTTQSHRKAPVMVRSHSMPENLDKLHRKKNFLSLIGSDNQSLYSQRSGGDDSSDESEYSVELTLHDKCPSTRSSQMALATLDETQEEETMTYAEALWDHVTMDPEELGFRAGDQIRVIDMMDKDWWFGCSEQHRGWFPAAFVRLWVNQEMFDADMTIQDPEQNPNMRNHGVDTDQGRANVVNEIINAEREYVKHLRDVVEGYLKQAKKRPEMFPKEKISIIFGNIEDIYSFANIFLASLEKAFNKEQPHLSTVGQVFLLHSQSFEIYSDYCNNHPGSGEEVKELYRKQKYRHFFEACRLLQEMIEIPLEGFLLTPVQKICKYHLQLNELLKYTPSDHPDYKHARAALDSMKKIATLINERKRKMESIEKIATWQASVDDWDGEDILQQSSELIYSGDLHKINSSGWSQERYFFLFDHQLVYCKKDLLKKNGFCYKGRIDLDHSEIIPLNDGKDTQYNVTVRHSWKVHDTLRDKWYLLVAKSEQVKQRWLKAFEDERKRVKDDQENNFNIPVHLKQTAINNLKQKSHLGKQKAKRKATRSTSLRHAKKPEATYPVPNQSTLPRKKQQDSLGDINQSKKLTWFFLGQGKKK